MIKSILRYIYKRLDLFLLKREWRKKNSCNKTYIANLLADSRFPINKVQVGSYTYGGLLVYSFGSDDEILTIGNFCSIGKNVRFILGGMHNLNTLSTYPFRVHIRGESSEAFSKGAIIIEDDVWIGNDAIILSGCTIARGTVIAAGSVVVNSTEPYSVVGGNPAKFIKKRFDEDIIDELMLIDFVELVTTILKDDRLDLLYSKVDLDLISKFKNLNSN